jgi:hypothetical protein
MGECVICLCADPPPVQSGCACRGDAGLAHAGCLIQKAFSQRAHRGSEAWTTCQTCAQDFLGATGLALAEARCESEPGMDARSFLGAMLIVQGRHADAERTCRGVLAESRTSLGDEHGDTRTSVCNLAAALNAQGKHAEAESLLRGSLRAGDAPETRLGLAVSLCGRGKYADAERILRGVVRERELASGTDSTETLYAKCNLGSALAGQEKLGEKLAEAEAIFREVSTLRRRVLGDEHVDTLVCLCDLASLCLVPRGMCAEAETIQRDVLAIQRRTIGEEHPETLAVGHNLAVSIWDQGRHEEARELLRCVHAALVRTQGRSHHLSVTCARTLAQYSARCAASACVRPVGTGGASIYCSRACRLADARAHKRTCTRP